MYSSYDNHHVVAADIPMLFEMSGLEDRPRSILQFAVTYGFMGLMTLVSLLLMDRVGRRPLWIFASLLMAAITAVTGLVFHFHLTGIVVLLVIILCTVPHGIALGGIPWLMMSELFPGVCILSFLFGLTMMPETKGRTLEEIAGSWRKP